MRSTNQVWIAFTFFIQNSWQIFHFRSKHVSSWFNVKNSTCPFMFQIWVFWSKFQFCTWNWLFGLHDKFVSFIIKSSQIFMKSGYHVQNISKLAFDLSNCVKHFSFSSYLLVTLHLPQPLTDGEASKDDQISYTHPNLNSSNIMDSIWHREHMRENPFWDFEFDELRHQNPNFTIGQNPQIAISQFLLIWFQIWR